MNFQQAMSEIKEQGGIQNVSDEAQQAIINAIAKAGGWGNGDLESWVIDGSFDGTETLDQLLAEWAEWNA